MGLFARIEKGLVAELVEMAGDIDGRFHPSLLFVEVTGENVAVGWRRTDTGFAPPLVAAPQAAVPQAAAQGAHGP